MILKKYQSFKQEFLVENVQNAKAYLRNRALKAKFGDKLKTGPAAKEGPRMTLTENEIREAESNRDFIKIRDLLRDNPGYTFAFTKFFFEEGTPFTELQEMYIKLKDYREFINQLPMSIESYANVVPSDDDNRKGFERLGDDLEKLRRNRLAKKWVDNLYGHIRKEYQSSTVTIKDEIEGIASSFDEFGKESNGTKDVKVNKQLQDLFFDKIKRYKNLNEVIQAALSYIKSANNSNTSKFYQNIQKTNQKYGAVNGVDIVYDDNGILIIEVKSFQANKELNSNTSHCIASTPYQWENYVGGDTNYNKQYYIYNFNLAPNDNKSIIGITIEPKQGIMACHLKDDSGFSNGIKDYMNKIKVPFSVLAPMSEEDQSRKKKRVIANKEIVKSNLKLADVKRYIEEGADPNALQGKPLENAVGEDDYEKTSYLLEQGANPNISNAIKKASNIKMIQLLVSHGSNLTPEIFTSISNDYDAIKFLLDANLDANYEHGLPLRQAVKVSRLDIIKLLIKYGARVSERRFMSIKWGIEYGSCEILKYLLDNINPDEVKTAWDENQINEYAHWVKTSTKIKDSPEGMENRKNIIFTLLDHPLFKDNPKYTKSIASLRKKVIDGSYFKEN